MITELYLVKIRHFSALLIAMYQLNRQASPGSIILGNVSSVCYSVDDYISQTLSNMDRVEIASSLVLHLQEKLFK